MKSAVSVTVFVFAASLCGALHAQTSWPSFMSSQLPGSSTSPVPAALPPDVRVESPAADLPLEKARWSGRWAGWACRDQACDTRLVVEKVSATGANIIYALASRIQKPYVVRVEATFVGDELQAPLPGGVARIAYRMRKSGDLEFKWQRNNEWVVGVLSTEK